MKKAPPAEKRLDTADLRLVGLSLPPFIIPPELVGSTSHAHSAHSAQPRHSSPLEKLKGNAE